MYNCNYKIHIFFLVSLLLHLLPLLNDLAGLGHDGLGLGLKAAVVTRTGFQGIVEFPEAFILVGPVLTSSSPENTIHVIQYKLVYKSNKLFSYLFCPSCSSTLQFSRT